VQTVKSAWNSYLAWRERYTNEHGEFIVDPQTGERHPVILGIFVPPPFAVEALEGNGLARMRCFPAGTLVLMADGRQKPIEAVRVGDLVLALDPESDDGTPRPYRVQALFEGSAEVLYGIEVRGTDGLFALIRATGSHPFWTQNRGWVHANELERNDLLADPAGRPVAVLDVQSIRGRTATYNITVDPRHTYYAFAGNTPVLVHNVEPLQQWQIVRMGDAYKNVGTALPRHEILQNAWLRYNNFSTAAMRNNLGMAIDPELHVRINAMQWAEGLHDEAILRSMGAEENIQLNADIMLRAGASEAHVENYMNRMMEVLERGLCK
jgi:hypothetical protein